MSESQAIVKGYVKPTEEAYQAAVEQVGDQGTYEEFCEYYLASFIKEYQANLERTPEWLDNQRQKNGISTLLSIEGIDWYNFTEPDSPEEEAETKVLKSWVYGCKSYIRFVQAGYGSIQDRSETQEQSIKAKGSSNSAYDGVSEKYQHVLRGMSSQFKVGKEGIVFDVWAEYNQIYQTMYINSETDDVEQDGNPLDLLRLYRAEYCTFKQNLGFPISDKGKDDFTSFLITYLERRNLRRSPWRDTINALPEMTSEEFQAKHSFSPERMAEFMLGDSRDLQQQLFSMQLVAVLQRSYYPGSKYDHMMVLFSEEKGLGKTTFLSLLTDTQRHERSHPLKQKYYLQTHHIGSGKEFTERLPGKVVLNIDECDGAFRGAKGAELKETISCATDNRRRPYDKSAKDYQRTVVFFGTTNQSTLIQDQAGDRRFLIMNVTKPIKNEWLKENWEDFWSYYKWLYKQNLQTWLTKDQERQLLQQQVEHKVREPWLDTLDGILDTVENGFSILVRPSDIMQVLQQELEGKRYYNAEHIKQYLMSERGYLFGKPRLDDGKQLGKPQPYKLNANGDKPALVTRRELGEALERYITKG
jgi:hypothetical protein